jgi:hypothetical protein
MSLSLFLAQETIAEAKAPGSPASVSGGEIKVYICSFEQQLEADLNFISSRSDVNEFFRILRVASRPTRNSFRQN